tara:strand:- start:294 stop:815 length:522 start_codon:yes stop_codon:yes gene_type:complete
MSQQRTRRQRQRARTRAQRQRQRTARQKRRQEQRTRRQSARQEGRTRRAQARSVVRQERVQQKGASGFYSPEGIRARGQVASDLVGQGLEIGALATTGGLSGLFGDGSRRDQIDNFVDGFGPQEPIGSPTTNGMVFGGGSVDTFQEEKPFYTNPLFIGGAVIGTFLLYRQFTK